MSKIGKINISIPEKVKVILSGDDMNIEGPFGKQSIKINLDVFDLITIHISNPLILSTLSKLTSGKII